MDYLRRFLNGEETPPSPQAEPMTDAKVDFGYRLYWTKMSVGWSTERRAEVRQRVVALMQTEDFEDNLIEKRYDLPLEGIPEVKHSGASLNALLAVLAALDKMDE